MTSLRVFFGLALEPHLMTSPWCLLVCVGQRQQKIQRDRLMSDFSAALNNFQAVQRRAAEKEKETVARARGGSRLSVSFLRGQQTVGVLTD